MSGRTRRQLLLSTALAAPIITLSANQAWAAPSRPPVVPARAAGTAFGSYGVNCHVSFLQSAWVNTDAAVAWLLDLGAGAVRQALPRSAQGREAVKRAMDQLGATGVRWCCPVLLLGDAPSLLGARAAVNGQLDWLQANTDLALLDSLPGPNEPNGVGGTGRKPLGGRCRRSGRKPQAAGIQPGAHPGASAEDEGRAIGIGPGRRGVGRPVAMDRSRGRTPLPCRQRPEWQVAERLSVLEPVHRGKPICVSEGGYTTALNRGYTGVVGSAGYRQPLRAQASSRVCARKSAVLCPRTARRTSALPRHGRGHTGGWVRDGRHAHARGVELAR